MKIIDNLSENSNHKKYILDMIRKSDELFIASPYLMRDFNILFNNEVLSGLKKINLITTLQPNSIDQIKKVYSLKSLIEIPKIKSGEIECKISLNNKLHGKIYIFKNSSNYVGGLISSANFTDSGLYINHEWGVTVTEEDGLNELENSIKNTIEPKFEILSHKSILRLLNHLNSFINANGEPDDDDIDLDLTEYLETEGAEKKKSESNGGGGSYRTYEYKITKQYLETWQNFFNEFVEFKKKNNEVTVPRDYENRSLYTWYRKQKIFNTNGTIPLDHKKKLEKVGFYFGDGHEIRWARIWEENYELLKAYFDDYGNSDVPHTRDKNDTFYSLGNWVAMQRTYNNQEVLSDYKIEKLNDLDFIWSKDLPEFNPRNNQWMDRYQELKEWTVMHGDAHVPQTNPDGTQNKLGRWLNDQRHLKRKGRKKSNGTIRYLDGERVDLLLELGVDFDHETNKHIDSFEKQLQEFLSFRYQYPVLNPPAGTFKKERDNLAQWRHKFDKLPEWKQKRLKDEKIM
ncbi:Helicase associated domain protein [Marivirga salinae]|uniref:Helicase associated domain protein n=1 Tax=Marivirga salinarum TaxID=3059078 RepID=A0AA51RC75_9BACT|nr:Helicase associated domain protein [Marivirga sp. BDSF4-3]WMN11373.1 Helicase associated domain protein [Marivirga sp. BDSF4-3]